MAKKFEELKLSPEVARVIKEFGHTEMFPIQEQALPKLLSGIDIIGQAQTGTGKTAAFAIPIVEKVIPNLREVQAIVLVPTRELAIQVSKEVVKYSKYKPMGVLAVYGGVSINDQIDRLQNTQVVVGTPGRVIDHLKRGTLNLGGVKIVVLDEADRMLDMGFVDDIKYILENVPRQRQTMLFSATMPESILYLAKEHMFRHELIAVSKDEMTVKDIEQVYVEVRFHERLGLLKKIIE
jgi:ATP-dependent RNA helicase DeaD